MNAYANCYTEPLSFVQMNRDCHVYARDRHYVMCSSCKVDSWILGTTGVYKQSHYL